MTFVSLVLIQFFHAYNCRSDRLSVVRRRVSRYCSVRQTTIRLLTGGLLVRVQPEAANPAVGGLGATGCLQASHGSRPARRAWHDSSLKSQTLRRLAPVFLASLRSAACLRQALPREGVAMHAVAGVAASLRGTSPWAPKPLRGEAASLMSHFQIRSARGT